MSSRGALKEGRGSKEEKKEEETRRTHCKWQRQREAESHMKEKDRVCIMRCDTVDNVLSPSLNALFYKVLF